MCDLYRDEISMPHAWFNIVEHNIRIYINTLHTGINDEQVRNVVLTVKNYTGNTLADEFKHNSGSTLKCYMTLMRYKWRLRPRVTAYPKTRPTGN